jgi:hypothetical protein
MSVQTDNSSHQPQNDCPGPTPGVGILAIVNWIATVPTACWLYLIAASTVHDMKGLGENWGWFAVFIVGTPLLVFQLVLLFLTAWSWISCRRNHHRHSNRSFLIPACFNAGSMIVGVVFFFVWMNNAHYFVKLLRPEVNP